MTAQVLRWKRSTTEGGFVLSLDSPRWSELRHAYGPASDIPAILRRLEGVPSGSEAKDLWESLWSSLVHQGDVYSASFAAVPHVIEALARNPLKADYNYFAFPAGVETGRKRLGLAIPTDLAPSYHEALSRIPELVATASGREWDHVLLRSALAAIAASKGQTAIAEVLEDLTPDVAEAFLKWNS